jgi:hypothetical protein
MANNAQDEVDQWKMKLSHVSLMKFLVVEDLRQLGSNWDSFLLTTGIPKDPKGDFPLSTERVISHHIEAIVEKTVREGKTSEALSSQ